jgi:hypothetical protein
MHEASKLVRQEELLNLLLLNLPLKACAIKMQLSYATLRKWASEPLFLDTLRNLSQSIYTEVLQDLKTEHKSVQDKLLEASDAALDRLKDLLDSKQEMIQLKAADSILDRTMETARNRKVEGNMTGHYSIDPVTLMHAAATSIELDGALTQKKALPPPPQIVEGEHPG